MEGAGRRVMPGVGLPPSGEGSNGNHDHSRRRRLTSVVKKFSRRVLFISALLVVLFFIVSGYILSDAFFFIRLVYWNSITSPEEAFAFVIGNTGVPDPRSPPPLEYSPRLMLTEQKNLFC